MSEAAGASRLTRAGISNDCFSRSLISAVNVRPLFLAASSSRFCNSVSMRNRRWVLPSFAIACPPRSQNQTIAQNISRGNRKFLISHKKFLTIEGAPHIWWEQSVFIQGTKRSEGALDG